MPVNLRRGFFRIWLAVSALWLIFVGAFSYGQVVSPYFGPQVYVLSNANDDFLKLDNVFDSYHSDFKVTYPVEISFANNVTLFAKNDIPKAVLDTRSKSFYEQYVKPREAELTTARWQSLDYATAIGLLPPLALLLLGLVIGWIVSGFKSTTQKS
jgi:hypothetical protein